MFCYKLPIYPKDRLEYLDNPEKSDLSYLEDENFK